MFLYQLMKTETLHTYGMPRIAAILCFGDHTGNHTGKDLCYQSEVQSFLFSYHLIINQSSNDLYLNIPDPESVPTKGVFFPQRGGD